jgi:hypothetical protein
MGRRTATGLLVLAVASGCGAGSLTVSEYAEAAEQLVATMESDFRALDADWESREPSVEGALDYWQRRLEIREEFLEGVDDLTPPEAIQGMHETALDVFGRITAADEALAARVARYDSITEHWQWTDTPEARASDAILQEVWAFCRASQADFDATAQGEAFEDMPWVPSEMTEVVSVAFGCPP